MRIKKKIPVLCGVKNTLDFQVPAGWSELEESQLRYVVFAISALPQGIEAKTYIFLRLTGIRVIVNTESGWICKVRTGAFSCRRFYLPAWKLKSLLASLDWVDDPGMCPVRLSKIGYYTAVDAELHEVPFRDYLAIENYYQGFLYTKKDDFVRESARLLYTFNGNHPDRIRMTYIEISSVMFWLMQIKNLFSAKFPYFFQRCEASAEPSVPNMESIMNSEIRALTGGDVTKESQVLDMDVWRALTELNEKAREIKELNEKLNHGH